MINMFNKMNYLHVSHFHTFDGKRKAPNEVNHEDSTNHIFGHVDNGKAIRLSWSQANALISVSLDSLTNIAQIDV